MATMEPIGWFTSKSKAIGRYNDQVKQEKLDDLALQKAIIEAQLQAQAKFAEVTAVARKKEADQARAEEQNRQFEGVKSVIREKLDRQEAAGELPPMPPGETREAMVEAMARRQISMADAAGVAKPLAEASRVNSIFQYGGDLSDAEATAAIAKQKAEEAGADWTTKNPEFGNNNFSRLMNNVIVQNELNKRELERRTDPTQTSLKEAQARKANADATAKEAENEGGAGSFLKPKNTPATFDKQSSPADAPDEIDLNMDTAIVPTGKDAVQQTPLTTNVPPSELDAIKKELLRRMLNRK